MAIRWLIRVILQVACGAVALYFINRWIPASSKQEDFMPAGVCLTVVGGLFAFADLAWPLLNRKLDESIGASSPLSSKQRSRWREKAFSVEKDYFFLFLSAITLKICVLAVGALLIGKVIPPDYCAQAVRISVFIAGCAIPPLLFLPTAYLSVRGAKIELARYEEEEIERAKALDTLRTAKPYDFDSDSHFAGYTKVIQPKV